MKRGLFLLLGAAFLVAGRAPAQDASVQDDMRFVEELRKQGKSDLALEYLEKIKKTASPELAKALPLEMARTRLEAAGEEPDSAKRLGLYGEARDEFQKWLAANPNDPHAGEVKLDLAHVTVQQGRTQLSRAFLNEDFDAEMTPEAGQARTLFEEAGAQLKQAAKDLDAQIAKAGEPKTPADKDLRKKLDRDRMQADLDVALNVFDQGQTYPLHADPTGEVSVKRNKLYQDAQALFEKLGAKDDQNPICWTAKAWAARCMHMLGDFPKAKERYKAILAAEPRYAADAIRLTQYFYVLLLDEAAAELRDKNEDDADIITRCKDWIAEYPGFLKTPEGYGVRFLLGKELVKVAATEKEARQARPPTWRRPGNTSARSSSRRTTSPTAPAARRSTSSPSSRAASRSRWRSSTNFEDCYVRAQFEMIQEAKGEKEAKTPDDADKVRKEHGPAITAALERGLKLADESKRGDEGLELANAKAMMAYQYMLAQEGPRGHRDRREVRPRGAALVPGRGGGRLCLAVLRARWSPRRRRRTSRRRSWRRIGRPSSTWPSTWRRPGRRSRPATWPATSWPSSTSTTKIDADDPDAARTAAPTTCSKAIEALSRITPNYAQYTVTQYQTAQFCFARRQGKICRRCPATARTATASGRWRPWRTSRRRPPGPIRRRTSIYFVAKSRLAQEDFTDKNFDEMEALTQTLSSPCWPARRWTPTRRKNKELHDELDDEHQGLPDVRPLGQGRRRGPARPTRPTPRTGRPTTPRSWSCSTRSWTKLWRASTPNCRRTSRWPTASSTTTCGRRSS